MGGCRRVKSPYDVLHAAFLASAPRMEALPAPATLEIAFAGRSNVGKSSLMNTLLSRRSLVRTSSTPGCTREIACFECKLRSGDQRLLVDLPGYGYARRSKAERSSWAVGIEGYLLGRVTLEAVVVLVDARRGLEQEEQELMDLLRGPARVPRRRPDLVLVATKLDRIPSSRRAPALARLAAESGSPVVGFSAVTGEGREALWRRLVPTAGRVAS